MKLTAIVAQAEAPPPADAQKGQPQVPFFMRPEVMLVFGLLFFLIVWLPQSRRQKREAAAKLAAIKPGSKVVTTAGIVGRIIKEDGDELVIKSDDTKLRILKTAVATVTSDETPATTDQKA